MRLEEQHTNSLYSLRVICSYYEFMTDLIRVVYVPMYSTENRQMSKSLFSFIQTELMNFNDATIHPELVKCTISFAEQNSV